MTHNIQHKRDSASDKINFAALMQPVAIKFWGQPRERSDGKLYWGSRNARVVDLAKGVWFDHEHNVGGGVLKLIMHEPSCACADKTAAMKWLRDNGFINGGQSKLGSIVEAYKYVDEHGKPLFEVVRFDPKDFRQRRRDNGSGWIWNIKGVRCVPFRLPQLIKAVKAGKKIFITEGEKDVIKLRKRRLAATTNPGGANKWRDEYSVYLEGADVVLLPDHDDPGRKHVAGVAAKLNGIAKSIRVVDLAQHWPEGADEPEEGADVSDWLEAGGTAEQLEQIADATPQWEPSEEEEAKTLNVVPAPNEPMLCAEKYLEEKQTTAEGVRTLRFHNGQFYRWTGTHYSEIDIWEVRGELYQFFKNAVYLGSSGPQAFRPNQNRVSSIIDAVKGVVIESRKQKPPFWMDGECGSAQGLIACRNGLFDITTRRLQPHTAKLFNVNSLPYDYDPKAPAYPPLWMQFLRQIWPGNEDGRVARKCLQEMFGLMLTTDTTFHKIFMLVGPTRSGKGTIGRVLGAMLGEDNVVGPTLDSMNGEFGQSQLIDKVLAIVGDARLGRDTNKVVEHLLKISGGDMININRKYLTHWHGYLNVRFLLLSNELPKFADDSATIASRFVVLMMEESFYGREDLKLTEKLRGELPSILNWSLIGLQRLQKREHFVMPQSSADAIRQIENLASPVKAFVRDWCEVGTDKEINTKMLFNAYAKWCEREGHKGGSNSVFGRNLRAVLPKLSDTEDGPRRRYVGIALSAYGQKRYDASCQP